ncbi:hypothetical protein [Alterisphingorhabdus coralli]|uniref:Uncharacterized protein n=1 Tax=Alterisphingorhabdus coralli TaxID=3071408 RepID=A0AA97I2U8_9SPHN|nr:hypothetical protein [Parasphingorhabdus sp. SCSIO 66989]WOE76085.1 hypothetical protein RB602_05035 [Parasphingorhabdus sp. SCSIO 66989]
MMLKYLSILTMICFPAASFAFQSSESQFEEAQTAREDDEIVVTGRRVEIEKAARQLAEKVALKPRSRKAMPRFSDPICLAIIGLDKQQSDAFRKRMYQNLSYARLNVSKKKCVPNMVVGFSNDISEELDRLVKEQPWLLGRKQSSERRTTLRRLADAEGASRAWRVTVPGDRFGNKLKRTDIVKGLPGVELPEIYDNPESTSGRIDAATSEIVAVSVVLLDWDDIGQATIGQLADFVTMRALLPVTGTPDDEVPTTDTILSLFSDYGGPEGLTEFDRAFLSGYYRQNMWTARYGATLSLVADQYADAVEDAEKAAE